MPIQVLRDEHGAYKIFVDRITKIPRLVPSDPSVIPPFLEERTFASERRVREKFGDDIELINRFEEKPAIILPPVPDSEIAGEMGETHPNPRANPPVLNTRVVAAVDPTREIIMRAKDVLKTKSAIKQKEMITKLTGFVEGLSFMSPGDADSFNNLLHEMLY